MENLPSGIKIIQRFVIVASISSILLAGCARAGQLPDAETMYIKASALTKLSKAVESTVRYKSPPENISDQELLNLATQDDPSLLEPFAGYTLKVSRESLHAIVLVCTLDSTKGLLEDAGCTAKLDNHLWQSEGNLCSFTLVADEICAAP